jgi:hypothetical protein
MELQSVKSSNVEAVGYDQDTQTLRVDYKAKEGADPARYEYDAVPKEAYDALMASKSMGAYIFEHIRGRYNYRKL